MIIIHVSVTTTAPDAQQFEATLRQVVAVAQAVRGCQRYEWYRDPTYDHRFIVYGEFDTEENFVHYKKSDVVAMIGQQLIPLTTTRPQYRHFRGEVFEQG